MMYVYRPGTGRCAVARRVALGVCVLAAAFVAGGVVGCGAARSGAAVCELHVPGADVVKVAGHVEGLLRTAHPEWGDVSVRADAEREVLLVQNASSAQFDVIEHYLVDRGDPVIDIISVCHGDAQAKADALRAWLAGRDGWQHVKVVTDRRTQRLFIVGAGAEQLEQIRSMMRILE